MVQRLYSNLTVSQQHPGCYMFRKEVNSEIESGKIFVKQY